MDPLDLDLSIDQLADFRWHLRNALDNNILEEIKFYIDEVVPQLHNDNQVTRSVLQTRLELEADLLRITFEDE
tara:strand:+ start:248 stop:466 length:219 start_codon:yes stop_codon:yes gene_type:complete